MVYNSTTYSKLTDLATGLYYQSPGYVYDDLKHELTNGKVMFWLLNNKNHSAENVKSISAKRFFILSRMIFRLAQIDFTKTPCWYSTYYNIQKPRQDGKDQIPWIHLYKRPYRICHLIFHTMRSGLPSGLNFRSTSCSSGGNVPSFSRYCFNVSAMVSAKGR